MAVDSTPTIVDLQRRQAAILRNALTQLAPGGLLVYSTCSLEREENEDVVEACGAQVIETMQRIQAETPAMVSSPPYCEK